MSLHPIYSVVGIEYYKITHSEWVSYNNRNVRKFQTFPGMPLSAFHSYSNAVHVFFSKYNVTDPRLTGED